MAMLDGFGALVAAYRDQHGLSRRELAKASGAGVRTIAAVEAGDNVDWRTIERLAGAMGIADLASLAKALRPHVDPAESPGAEGHPVTDELQQALNRDREWTERLSQIAEQAGQAFARSIREALLEVTSKPEREE